MKGGGDGATFEDYSLTTEQDRLEESGGHSELVTSEFMMCALCSSEMFFCKEVFFFLFMYLFWSLPAMEFCRRLITHVRWTHDSIVLNELSVWVPVFPQEADFGFSAALVLLALRDKNTFLRSRRGGSI